MIDIEEMNVNNIHYETCMMILRNPNINKDVKLYQVLDLVEQGMVSVKMALVLLYKYKVIDTVYKDLENEHNENYVKYNKMLNKMSRTCQKCGEDKPYTLDIDRLDVPYNVMCEECWTEYQNDNDLA